jgi:polygalacturonase
VAFLADVSFARAAGTCEAVTFGAVGDGHTDNTTAIQKAIDACASRGGGTVQLSASGDKSTYLTGPLTLRSHIRLQVDQGVTLQGTNDHSRYVGSYINWVYQPHEALISAQGATDVGIAGAGTIDGAGGQLQPNGDPSWWTLGRNPSFYRPWLIEFYQCDHVTITGVTLQNSPFWTQSLRFSHAIKESGVTVRAPETSPNTDGFVLVGSTDVTVSDLDISVGDDIIAIKSGLPIDPTDPKQRGIPRMATSQVHVANIVAGHGHGVSIGSESANGVNNVTIQGVHFTGTSNGFRLKTGRDRGSQIYAITASDLTMTGVDIPLIIYSYYPTARAPAEPPYEPAHAITSSTPYVHDITVRNLVATDSGGQSIVQGLPESCIRNLSLNNVSIQTRGLGIDLRHVTGTFNNVTSTAADSKQPFIVEENVSVTATGNTPSIPATQTQTGQIACAAQSSAGK